MILQPIPATLAGGATRRSSGEAPFAPRLPRRVLAPIRADSPPISVSSSASSAAPSRPPKPPVCTADELHYAPVGGAGWRLALWRYRPPRNAPVRNHPLMLLSGVGTNAIGFDLSPGASFARHMSSQGFDTWIVEVRGAGLSIREYENSAASGSVTFQDASGSIQPLDKQGAFEAASLQSSSGYASDCDDLGIVALDEPPLLAELSNFFDRISKLMEEAATNGNFHEITEKVSVLSEMVESSTIIGPVREESLRLLKNFQDQLDSWERFVSTQMDLTSEYNWDFDHYLEEDIPAAVEYIRQHSKTKDGKLLAIGHSMGGILLYAMLSRSGFEGVPSNLAAIVTLASSVDYTTSNSSLKLLLPLAHPAQALNVPAVPLGTLLAAAYPWASGPPYLFSWLNPQISAQDMMHPELLSKLVFNNFCTVPAKVVLQLTTAFREGGLCNRNGTFSYKDHLRECQTPVLALAGDKDLICPPEAVYETAKLIPKHKVKYRVFGKPQGPHYAHYDLVGGRLAIDEVYPCIIEFLSRHD
ncbi:hypothetical protein SEVIR_6G134000v4 [Setaria viridis]|uniref:AB hydrolase-1 domain-containing protein n=1 Tax=Setaria viridis TaxID=4556 RepID=A0A4U6U4T1_SETVI|nr:uncharacterized protein LOC117862266 [Setaria viridis]TKW09931.1 hypothetical protein SEVIR_6G134000v2 [Setaria viridis]TKW09932.1 hypothetical protein SEVIR_6G134000v2 [Setaria viridis]